MDINILYINIIYCTTYVYVYTIYVLNTLLQIRRKFTNYSLDFVLFVHSSLGRSTILRDKRTNRSRKGKGCGGVEELPVPFYSPPPALYHCRLSAQRL